MPSPKSRYQIPGLLRGLRVLEYLGERPDGATLAAIASDLQFPKNSVYRITITMREAGFVEHDEASGCWSLSQKLVGLGFAAMGGQRLIEEAKREMQAIRDVARETTLLCVLHDTSAVIVDEVPGLHAFRFVIEPGYRTPLHCSAQGKVFLAYLPEWRREELLGRMRFTALTDRTMTSRDKFRNELARVLERGYGVDLGEAIEGVHCVSAPVFDHKGEAVAAITVTGPSERLRPEDGGQLGELIRRHADLVSKRLGFIPGANGDTPPEPNLPTSEARRQPNEGDASPRKK